WWWVPIPYFFSSRRRHTRLQGDWSSDVCSSDLTNSQLANTEIFGPVLSLIHANSIDEAMEFLRRSPYGNQASLFTTSGSAARKRSEEHTSELQSPCNLVCRLLLEKK